MASDVEVSLPSGTQRETSTNSRPLRIFLLIALLLVIAADWLFWGQETGISLAIFALLIGAAAVSLVNTEVNLRRKLIAIAVLVGSILPVVEMVQTLSILFLVFGMISFALIIGEKFTNRFLRNIGAFAIFPTLGVVWLWQDAARKVMHVQGELPAVDLRKTTTNWIVPIGMGLVFLGLFSEANPLIDKWLVDMLDVKGPSVDGIFRLGFWAGILCLVWPFLRIRYARWLRVSEEKTALKITVPSILNASAIRNALVVFNVMFAFQTVLDFAILWGGASLPDGMTYAAYAHRGAYPLIVTALLAGGFVVLATSFGEVSKLLKGLIYLWIAQNIALVFSSILRLDLYVEVYSLTRLRMAAIIWMGLVAVGLILIVVRVAKAKNNQWLVLANGMTAGIVLYVCCFVNFSGVIAQYNIDRQGGVAAVHQPWDVSYFCGLGHGAAPAKARYVTVTGRDVGCSPTARINRAPELADWRGWGFRDWRLRQELAKLGITSNEAMVHEPDYTYRGR